MQDSYVHVCSHLDTLSAIRFAATSKSIRTAVKGLVDNRCNLLPKRVVMPMVRDLQEHLLSKYLLHTVLAFQVAEHKCFHVDLKSDATERVARVWFTLDDPSVHMSMHLPWRKDYTPGSEQYQSFTIDPTTEMAGTVDHAKYGDGLSKALLEREIIWTPTSHSRPFDTYDEVRYNEMHAYDTDDEHVTPLRLRWDEDI